MGLGNWNYVYQDGDDVFTVAIYQMFVDAWNLRGLVRPVYEDPLDTTFKCWSYAFFRSIQIDFGIYPLSQYGDYVEDLNYDGHDYLTPLNTIDADYVKAHGLGGRDDYTRKYPKEFNDLGASSYTDSNPFVDGDYARCLNDEMVYQRVSGAWVLSAGSLPSVTTAYGRAEVGDYVGAWLFNEARDVINCFDTYTQGSVTWRSGSGNNFIADTTGGYDGTASDATLAGAKGVVAAAWGSSTGNTGDNRNPSWNTELQYAGVSGPRNSAPEYFATAARVIGKAEAADSADGYAEEVDFYSYGFAYGLGTTTFEGDGLCLEGLLKKWDTQTGTGGGGVVQSADFGTLTIGAWAPDPDVPSNPDFSGTETGAGYIVDAIAVIKRDITGGWPYTKSSPS